MLFNSWQFGIFLPLVFVSYWALPHKFRWILILTASYYFYMSWNVKYVILILFTTIISYVAAILLEHFENHKLRKIILAITLISCLGVLFVFKYFNFFSEAISDILKSLSIQLNPVTLKLLLPVGISFYTFQTLGYVIDVYRNNVKAERHFGYYAAFISFFPQLVAGPIERTNNLLPQIKSEHFFDYSQATYGLKLMAWGFFKKLVIADNLAVNVDTVYNDIQSYKGFALILASLFFTIQIYCDFSGYSDIARGSSKLMGIDLMENFKSPYFSASIKEFWSRWHISLSTWFRDYLYIPLGGNRVKKSRHYFNLLITFLISGLWHGANWTFIIWGGIHGLAQIIEDFFSSGKRKELHGIRWFGKVIFVFTFCSFAWIFFRAQNIFDIKYIFLHCFDGISNIYRYLKQGFINTNMLWVNLQEFFIYFTVLFLYDYISLKHDLIIFGKKHMVLRWISYVIFLWLMFVLIPLGKQTEFIYFQF